MARITKKAPPKKIRITAAQVAAQRDRSKRDMSPKWDGSETWTAAQFARAFYDAMQYYGVEYNAKASKTQVIRWMMSKELPKAQVADYKKTKDWRTSTTMGGIAACLLKGMPPIKAGFNKDRDSSVWLMAAINKVIREGKLDIDDDAPKDQRQVSGSIQDRTKDLAYAMTDDIEDAYELYQLTPDKFNPDEVKVFPMLKSKGAKPAHARIIKEFYQPDLDELTELASGAADPQLKEAYRHRPRKYIRNLITFLTDIRDACNMLSEEAKVERKPRTPKPVSNEKLVEKLVYHRQNEALKLVSINPIDIIGATELWCYNVKTRKIGKYIAANGQTLTIKGSSILGYDEAASIQKTLRKPAEQLAAFKSANKVTLRKFLDNIGTVDTKLTGRINIEIVLLKAIKP